jgi:protein-disulfide isomerase
MLAAQAAHAAHRQGKFWPMARLLFERQDSHTEQGALKLAREVGLRLDTFQAAQKELALLREIEANKILGLRLGVAATPALFVNGKPFLLPKDELHLVDRVEEELELLEEKRR